MQSSLSPRQGLFVVIGVALVFFASWWNRYVPPTNGGDAVLMAPWAGDYLPYRDYFMPSPPGMPILVRGIIAVAGPRLIATLTFGVLLRVSAACALYALLLAIARPSYAALAVITALFVSSTDISDTPFFYNHVGIALVVIGTYLGLTGGGGTRPWHWLSLFGAGVALTYAVATKQTMVFGSAAALVALVVLLFPRPRSGWVPWLAGLVAGAAATIVGIWVWLARNHLVSSFVFVMQRAPDAKGGILRSLFRPLSLLFEVHDEAYASVAAWIVIAFVAIVGALHRRGMHNRRDVLVLLLVLLFGSLVLFMGVPNTRIMTLFLTAVGWWGSLALAVVHGRSLRMRSIGATERAIVALGLLAFGIGYCFAVSWPLFENMAFPGLAVLAAALMEHPPAGFRKPFVGMLVMLAILSMELAVYRKFTAPHGWGLWSEPPLYTARGRFEHPALAGMHISEASSDLYAMVSQIAHGRTAPDDRIYVYPNMAILYAIADRRPATYALAHWVDTCPDYLGQEDAARLRANPPRLMIVRPDPIGFIAGDERLYRGGRRSSVRDVVKAINDLAPLYERVAEYRSEFAPPIIFFLRRNPQRE